MNHPFRSTSLIAIGMVCTSAFLTGCGMQSTDGALPSVQAVSLSGNLRGGQQPVVGAVINLYAAGNVGNGSGAVDLLANQPTTTNSTGTFTIVNPVTCPSASSQVYVVARGGNPGLANNSTNPALVEMATLGDCGRLSSTTFVQINEVTTVAAVWALAPFLGPNAIVGASSTNATGLANAFKVATDLVNVSTGTAPGAGLPAGSILESAKMNSLANALATCINSDGGTPCGPLFSAASGNGNAPSNTVDAALNIVTHPGNNVMAVYAAGSAQGPFQPTLATAPHDWTLSMTLQGGALNQPGGVALDSTGGAWIANFSGGKVSHFLPDASNFPVAGAGLRNSFAVTVDSRNVVWVANEQSVSKANNSQFGSVSAFANSTEVSGFGYTGGGIYYPQSIAADSNGTIWVGNYGSSSASLLAPDGSALSGSQGIATSALPFTTGVALDASHNAWFAAQGVAVKVSPSGTFSSYQCCTSPAGIAVDQTGNIWIADYGADSVVRLSAQGQLLNRVMLAGGLNAPNELAVDGVGNVWTANYYGNSVAELAGASAALLSPTLGFGQDAPLNEPYSIAIDQSGNLWISNAGGNTLTVLVGLASPIATPLLGPPALP